MSYILEALKKSDRERKQGKVPTLETIQDLATSRSRPPNPLWPYVLLTALAISGLLLGGWLIWREPTPPPTAATPLPAAGPVSAESGPGLPQPARVAGQSVENIPPSGSPIPATVMPGAFIANTLPAPQTIAPHSTPETEATEIAEVATSADAGEAAAPQPSGDNIETRIVTWDNLPAELKEELPEIKIGVHLYSENPITRRASINGRLLREGQLVGPGLHLEEITRQGAIFSFRGRKFSVAVFRR